MIYFNEHDAKAAAWLRNLYPEATVDARSIHDVKPDDVAGFRRCHFFGGIAGWQYALELAGWPDEREVWTGSCPCQPFSSAGKRKGNADERHLWPEFRRLIAECRPATVFGEQVASKDGRAWLAGVRVDMEALGYAFGAADLPACCVGSPMAGQRLYWVASSVCSGFAGLVGEDRQEGWQWKDWDATATCRRSSTNAAVVSRVSAEPSARPLAYGIPRTLGRDLPELRSVAASARSNRVARLRGYGNAIVPQVAAEFIRAFMETL